MEKFRRRSTGGFDMCRYEHNGVLVYDSHARLSDQPIGTSQLRRREPAPQILRDLSSLPEYGKSHLEKQQYLSMKAYPPSKPVLPEYTIVAPSQNSLTFDSRFESGNLWKAIRITENEYNLLLDYDINTEGHTQWFYFAVNTYKANHPVKFNIINLFKCEALYNNGFKPLFYSLKNQSWSRTGSNVSYFQNQPAPNTKTRYTLTFQHNFEHANDTVYFAHCYPYTYSMLTQYLKSQSVFKSILKVETLCKTLAGNPCPVLTLTENVQAGHQNKQCVFLTARVHPGQSNSSLVMEGALDYLLSGKAKARQLRKQFVFKIVPMLNPDGVIYGNYRCSLLGVDLNRRWRRPNKHLHPTVFYSKELMKRLAKQVGIGLFCDMHGHSLKKNSFMYACADLGDSLESKKNNGLIRFFPHLMSQAAPMFSMSNSRFRFERCKQGTARIVAFKEIGILHSYTLETSFYGSDVHDMHTDGHFSIKELKLLGKQLMKTLLIFKTPQNYQSQINLWKQSLTNNAIAKPAIYTRVEDVINSIPEEEFTECEFDSESDGSDACPTETEYSYPKRKTKKPKRMKKRYPSRVLASPVVIVEDKPEKKRTATPVVRRSIRIKMAPSISKKVKQSYEYPLECPYKLQNPHGFVPRPFTRISKTSGGFRGAEALSMRYGNQRKTNVGILNHRQSSNQFL